MDISGPDSSIAVLVELLAVTQLGPGASNGSGLPGCVPGF